MPKFIGNFRLGRDADLKSLSDGTAVANLSLAYNYGKADQSGNRPTTWIDAAMFGKMAESIAQFLLKGSVHEFTLEGLHIQHFDKNDGTQGTKLSARVLSVELGPRMSQQQEPPPRQQSRPPAAAPAPRQQGQQRPPAPTQRQNDDWDNSDPPF